MDYIVVDYESYYDREYSLRKITPIEYILDARFECFGAAVAVNSEPVRWVDHVDLPVFFAALDPNNTVLIYHNAGFDACITSWRYNFRPRLNVDTLGMARALLGYTLPRFDLTTVATRLGLGEKGTIIKHVTGMRRHDMEAAGLWEEFKAYARQDAELERGVFRKLAPLLPPEEFVWNDMVIRWCCEPCFTLNGKLVQEHYHSVLQNKQVLLDTVAGLGVDKPALVSNDKFAEVLVSLGVDPPTKISQTTGKETFAFAKTDPDFLDLQEHEDDRVQAVVAARLGNRTTLEEKRSYRFMMISTLGFPMPVPLKVSGAHTHRLSGDWKLNLQNLPRGGNLRRALEAPPGYKVVTCDASQVEARIVAWLAGQEDLLEQFAEGRDTYSIFASKVFGVEINKRTHPVERFIGKTAVLGLGYGLGWEKFARTVGTQSLNQVGRKIVLDEQEARRIVGLYRRENSRIRDTWGELQSTIIPRLATTGGGVFGPCQIEREVIVLPGGMRLYYHQLQNENGEWVFTYGGRRKRVYGGKLLENITQAVAFVPIKGAMLRMKRRFREEELPARLVHQVHDEAIAIAEAGAVNRVKEIMLEEMRRRPSWALSLPLDAEAGFGPSYGEAK